MNDHRRDLGDLLTGLAYLAAMILVTVLFASWQQCTVPAHVPLPAPTITPTAPMV